MITQQHGQKQNLQISPKQIQLLNFFALNVLELEQQIKTELSENPFLEATIEDNKDTPEKDENEIPDLQEWSEYDNEDVPDKAYEYQNYISKEQLPSRPMAYKKDFKEDAKQQLSLLDLDADIANIAAYLIDTLDERGLLDRPLDEIAEEYGFQQQKYADINITQQALQIVQSLEPIGIGATSIRECLLLQLKKSDLEDRNTIIAIKLIDAHYDELVNRQFEKICTGLRIDNDTLKKVFVSLRKLKIYPVCESTSAIEPKQTIVPDYVITCTDGNVSVNLYSSKSDSLSINNSLYEQIREVDKGKDKAAEKYIKNKITAAQWFIGTVKQREETMLRTMKCIVDFQYEYFLEGDVMLLKPMVLRNIATLTGYDICTLSRITCNKYAETHFGIVYLKDLFSEGISDQSGEIVSSKVIQNIIKETIDSEDKNDPFTDQKLVTLLSSMGYNIARRTVAKYRERLNIPIAQVRHVLI